MNTQPPASWPAPPAPADAGLLTTARRHLRTYRQALSTPTHPPSPLFGNAARRWQRRLPYAVALVLIAALLPTTVNLFGNDYHVLPMPLALALAAAQTLPLLLSVTRPLQAWRLAFGAAVVGALLLVVAGNISRPWPWPPTVSVGQIPWPWPPTVIVGQLFLLVPLALRERRATLVSVWASLAAAGLVLSLLGQEHDQATSVLLVVLSGIVLLVVGALRERGDARRQLAEQESISEEERARRTLLEERARIARELHDVVAHHMSVITVQADSAAYRIDGLPPAAREEFTAIAATARESLSEMRRLLGVLRNDNDAAGARTPQPGLGHVPHLVEATRRAGVPVELETAAAFAAAAAAAAASQTSVPQAVELSAYRIVQEALANVVRHAPGAPTTVSLTHGADRLTVLVVNGPPAAAARHAGPVESSGTGHGLVGMRERVRLVGGALDTGPLPDGGYRVAATLPLAPPAQEGKAGEEGRSAA